MFDTVIVRPQRSTTEYATREVHEHRAPTDESVKLLREMEAAAEAKRVDSIRLDGNGFTGLVEVMEDFANDDISAQCVFDLNGTRHKARVVRKRGIDKAQLIVDLRDELAAKIASVALQDFVARARITL